MNVTTALLLLFTAPGILVAQSADPCATAPASCATIIETHASSNVRIPNTAVDISVAVRATGKDMAEVQRSLTEKSNALLAYLKQQKVERLITSSVSFSPETRYDKNGPDKTVGYSGNSSVSFRTTPEKAADVLAGVLTSGANEIQSTTFTPTEQEVDAARRHLSEEATRTAIAEAEAIARAAGLKVAAIRNISVNGGGVIRRPVFMAGMMMAKANQPAMAPMETSAGDQELSVEVNITAAATH